MNETFSDGELKTVDLKNFKMDAVDGTFAALFAPFERWDKAGDWTEKGAFGRQRVVISAYGHGTTVDGRLPVGKGVIYDTDEGGVVEGQLFLKTSAGKETYETLKELGDLQQWSYYLPRIESEQGTRDGRKGRILKKIEVGEVCPVLRGVGNGTRTLAIKSVVSFSEQFDTAIREVEDVFERLNGRVETRKTESRRPSPQDLKRARALDERLGELMRKLRVMIKENDSVDDAWLYLQSLSVGRE
jgi:hypothetical protein